MAVSNHIGIPLFMPQTISSWLANGSEESGSDSDSLDEVGDFSSSESSEPENSLLAAGERDRFFRPVLDLWPGLFGPLASVKLPEKSLRSLLTRPV